jgi:hypothetical protein
VQTIAWLFALVIASLSLSQGHAYRLGHHRGFLTNYRNPTLPTVLRNGALVLEPVAVLAFVGLGLTAPLALIPALSLQRHVLLGLFLLVVGYALVVGGIGVALSYWLPWRLIPDWLLREDEATGWSPHGRDFFDRLIVVFGLLCLLGGALSMVIGSGFALAPDAFGIGA